MTLKSGEKLEGKITSETDTEITLEQKISAGITDSRVVAKSEVLKVDKEQPDVVAWQSLKNLRPGTNSLPSTTYDATLRSLEGFVNEFPQSAHLADAKKSIADFQEEKSRVDDGEVKLNGKWLSKAEAQNERYQINGLLAFNYMKEQSAGGDFVGALNTFDAMEKQFPGARTWPDAVELARRIAASLKAEVDRRQPMVVAAMAERAKGIQLASIAQRTEMEAAAKRETAAAEATMAAAEKRGLKWPPLLVNHQKSLTALQGKLASEIPRLATIEVAPMRQSIQLAETAQQAISTSNFEVATIALTNAKELWSANELAERLQVIAAAGQLAAQATPAAAPVESMPAESVPTPPGTSSFTEKVSEASSAATAALEEAVEERKSFLAT
ncbi:MAG: PTPDL family protein, partial [Verrucomicrobiota bacterium]